MNLLSRLLKRNISVAQLAGFVLANFTGLAIVIAGLQFYMDVRSLWEGEDSFVKKDYLVVNKTVKSVGSAGEDTSFSEAEISELESQPWVRRVGRFESSDYSVAASMGSRERGLSTYMFFESVPSDYIDVKGSGWRYEPGSGKVPIIISKDYLTLYNFGFASSAGMPQVSESVIGSVPLALSIRGENGRSAEMTGEIVGFSNRLNTILVPQEFMDWSNSAFGSGAKSAPSRLIIDVSSPGDVAIAEYLENHGLEQAGDKSASRAGYFLNVVTGAVLGVGIIITVLSLFILMLSVSLLMQKNRAKLHALIMLGFSLRKVGSVYRTLVIAVSLAAYILACVTMFILRGIYIRGVQSMGGGAETGLAVSLGGGLLLTAVIIIFNVMAVNRKVKSAF